MAEKTKEQWRKEWEDQRKDDIENYTTELVPLSREEAIAAMKAGERLVNGTEPYHSAHYQWYDYRPYIDKDQFLKSDSWYDLAGEGEVIPENELPQLYRIKRIKKE